MSRDFIESELDLILVVVDGCHRLNIRDEATSTSDVIEVLNKGDILEKVASADQGSFSRVRLTSGKYGYAMTRYLREV